MNEDTFLMPDEEQDKLYPLSEQEKKQWQTWVPEGKKITNIQIYDAKSRGIPMPIGDKNYDQEYIMYINEIVLVNKKTGLPPNIHDGGGNGVIPPKTPSRKKGNHSFWGAVSSLFHKKAKSIEEPEEIVKDNPKDDDNTQTQNQPNDLVINTGEPLDETPITTDKVIDALNKYLSEDKENVLVKIVEKFKSFVLPLLLAALIAFLGTCFRKSEIKNTTQLKEIVINYIMTQDIQQNYEQALRETMEQISIGSHIELEDGQKFNTNSRMTGTTKELGKEFDLEHKYAGKYPITGFSIVRKSDNQILAYIEDFYAPSNNTKLSTFVDETLANHNINFEDINIEFHFGRTDRQAGERSRLGWIEDGNVVLNEDEIRKSVEEAATYKGTIENFEGDTITITTSNGEVKIPIKDASGNFYKPGDKVVGSDNNVYEINELEQTITAAESNAEGNKKITFSLKNGKLAAALPFVMMALLDYIIKKRKNKIAENNPYFKLVPSEELPEYIEEFQNGKTKIYKEHKGTTYGESLFMQLIIEGYYEKTGIKVSNIEDLGYEVQPDAVIVYKLDDPEKRVDITDYIVQKTGNSIGSGWDNEAEETFNNRKGGH